MKRTFKTAGKHDVDLAVQRAQEKAKPVNLDGPMIGKPSAKKAADDAQTKLSNRAAEYTAQVLFDNGNIETADQALDAVWDILTSPEEVPDMIRIRGSVALLKAVRERREKK